MAPLEHPWTTNYPTSQDDPETEQPTLTDDSAPGAYDGDRLLWSQLHALRDKLDAACKKLGDVGNLPAGCVAAKVASLESAPPSHAASHNAGGGDALAIDAVAGTGSLRTLGTAATAACAGNDARLSDARTPTSHATSHKSGGGDSIKLDELAAPTDVTTLNASTGAHGLLPKLSGNAAQALLGDGTWGAAGSASPLTTKGDLYTFDTADARLPVGANGTVLTADDNEATGVKWTEAAGGFTGYEEEFTAAGGDEDFNLSVTPDTNTNMLSGVNIIGVFRNGQRLRYRAAPATGLEYGYTAGTTINCKALSVGDIITVVFSSQGSPS